MTLSRIPQMLTTAQAAEYINTPAATLRYWRHQGVGPKSFRLGPRRVMYRVADLDEWVAAAYAQSVGDGAA